VLDYVPNPRPAPLSGALRAPEFTSLCPVTGQPDFAHLVIDYAPGETIVESKSLKLFLGPFRNHCGFHEDVTVGIGKRLADEMKPKWLRIGGYWYPRGGMPIDVFWQSGSARGAVDSGPGRGRLSRARLTSITATQPHRERGQAITGGARRAEAGRWGSAVIRLGAGRHRTRMPPNHLPVAILADPDVGEKHAILDRPPKIGHAPIRLDRSDHYIFEHGRSRRRSRC
jgi:7-cyano-7-deazaguanine reductase